MANSDKAPTGDLPTPSQTTPVRPSQEPGLVGQVRIVSILMMLQGLFELLVALFVFLDAFIFDFILGRPPSDISRGGPFVDLAILFRSLVYGGVGVVLVIIAAFRMFAGCLNWSFKERDLGVISLVTGLGAVFSFYCAPTSVALCIFGMIVYLNAPVAAAFRMGEEGHSGDEIIATFSRSDEGRRRSSSSSRQ